MHFDYPEEWVRFRESENLEEQYLAAHGMASIETWMSVIERFPETRKWVALNKNIPMEVLVYLSDDSDRRVRRVVATKRKLKYHRELQEKLARDPDVGVRRALVANRSTPRELLERLVQDEDESVSEFAQQRLAQDGKSIPPGGGTTND